MFLLFWLMLPLRFFLAEFAFESSVVSQQVGIFRYELVAVKKIEFKLFMSCNLAFLRLPLCQQWKLEGLTLWLKDLVSPAWRKCFGIHCEINQDLAKMYCNASDKKNCWRFYLCNLVRLIYHGMMLIITDDMIELSQIVLMMWMKDDYTQIICWNIMAANILARQLNVLLLCCNHHMHYIITK